MLKPSYQAIEDVVLTNEAQASAAEAHGILAGLLCVNAALNCEEWLSQVFDEAGDGLSAREMAVLRELYDATRAGLEAVDFSFELFLPDDAADLAERALALSGWCQGFLYGVGYAGAGWGDWPGDCSEVLRDLADISQLDTNAAGEADEEAYTEISEFVRLGVQLVRGELQQPPPLRSRLH